MKGRQNSRTAPTTPRRAETATAEGTAAVSGAEGWAVVALTSRNGQNSGTTKPRRGTGSTAAPKRPPGHSPRTSLHRCSPSRDERATSSRLSENSTHARTCTCTSTSTSTGTSNVTNNKEERRFSFLGLFSGFSCLFFFFSFSFPFLFFSFSFPFLLLSKKRKV